MNIKKIYSYTTYGITILFFLILISAGYYYSSIQRDDGLRINLAGRQRMLSQKIFKEILLFNNGEIPLEEIERTVRIFTETQNALIYGGDAPVDLELHDFRKLSKTADNKSLTKLIEVKNEWTPIEERIVKFTKNRDQESLKLIVAHDKSLLTKIDNSVYTLQLRSEKNTMIIRIVIICSFISIFILLIINILKRIREIRSAELRIKELETLLPICSNCKKIRTDNDNPMNPESWTTIEEYLHEKDDTKFTHGICPDCINKLYPGMMEEMKKRTAPK